MVEPLVLLPGLMCDARMFFHQIVYLSQARAVTVAPITTGERVEEIASGLLDQLPHRFALAGACMGGVVALELIRRAPERITRLCLMATEAQADTPQMAAAREDLIVGAQAGRLDEVMRKVVGSEALAPGTHRIPILTEVLGMASDMGADIFVRQMRALQRRPDQQGTLRRIKVPTLVLSGAHDTLMPTRKHAFMADLIPEADLMVIEDARPCAALETPGVVTAAMDRWLNQPLRLI